MADTESPAKFGGAYSESEHHRPDPTAMYDQYNTSGTGAHDDLSDITPVFDHAKHRAQVRAGQALDPKNDDVPESEVVFQDNSFDRKKAEERVKAKAQQAEKQGPPTGAPLKSERAAAATPSKDDNDTGASTVPGSPASKQATEKASKAASSKAPDASKDSGSKS